jgi:aminoglycoside phosphotransferase (APT) family kinase protein
VACLPGKVRYVLEFSEIQAAIPPACDWVSAAPLMRGIGFDKKYVVHHRNGDRYLLRLYDVSEYAKKQRVFDLITQTCRQADIPMPRPIDLGISRDGHRVYMVLSWLEGEDFDTGIPALSDALQYAYGVESGRLLKRIHGAVEPDSPSIDSEQQMRERLDELFSWYDASFLRFAHDETVRRYLRDNLPLMQDRPQTILHNDFHVGNLILQPDGTLGIIDFDYVKTGDPLEDTRWMLFTRSQGHVTMANGQVHGYFEGARPTADFFAVMAYYAALGLFSSLQFQWRRRVAKGLPVDAAAMEPALKGLKSRIDDFDTFRATVPLWYRDP